MADPPLLPGQNSSLKRMMGPGPCCCHCLQTVRFSRLILAIFIFLLTVTLCTHYFLSRLDSGPKIEDEQTEIVRQMLGLADLDDVPVGARAKELKQRVEDLLRIKTSVQKELRHLEERRTEMQKQVTAFVRKIEELKAEATQYQMELDKLRMSIEQARTARLELAERNTPEIRPPLRLLASKEEANYKAKPYLNKCSSMGQCFDLSRCSISSGFPVYTYNHDDWMTSDKETFGYMTDNPDKACLYVVTNRIKDFEQLSHWNGDGRNHIIVDLSALISQPSNNTRTLHYNDIGRAMVASSAWFDQVEFRPEFDLVLPSFSHMEMSSDLWPYMASMVPIRRHYLFSFQGPKSLGYNSVLKDTLTSVNVDKTDDQVFVDFECLLSCSNSAEVLLQSTFNIIITPHSDSVVVHDMQVRLYEAMKAGSIPVFVCDPDCVRTKTLLPFYEFVDWTRAALFVPLARITELHFLLRSLPDSDLFAMKRQGRLVWQSYLGSGPAVAASLLNVIRSRLGIPAAPITEEPSPSVFNGSFTPLVMDSLPPDMEPGESLGPLEPPMASATFRRNFSMLLIKSDLWNERFMEAFRMPPYTPWEPVLPTEAKFLGTSVGFRPIGGGEGGSGREFSQALGGNIPGEQFTVVMLTYEREQVLVDSLSRLYGLPYLNKVIVVWNSEVPPSPDLRWPEIGVPIVVMKTSKNSLNNRFLPYTSIETEAVLSVDDDAHLRHDEIIFGFRVWREHRHRLVGFPGRFHAWNKVHTAWNYNSNYSCELSMVLTGAAFYHKYYAYAYSQLMPQAIREKVDQYMNCEDLAMNFLISHMTRQPPVKVTSRWTFRCPGCPVSLSEDESHFQERHECINYFVKVYGYNPLLYTQYRADSVLFKTRIAQDKQKCFKFI